MADGSTCPASRAPAPPSGSPCRPRPGKERDETAEGPRNEAAGWVADPDRRASLPAHRPGYGPLDADPRLRGRAADPDRQLEGRPVRRLDEVPALAERLDRQPDEGRRRAQHGLRRDDEPLAPGQE